MAERKELFPGRYSLLKQTGKDGRLKIVFFRIQYETKINDIWYPVVRYDTAHGFAHRDSLSFPGVHFVTDEKRFPTHYPLPTTYYLLLTT